MNESFTSLVYLSVNNSVATTAIIPALNLDF